jgi:serine protease Do
MLLGGVSPGSPAENAGLLAGDVLIQIDEAEIKKTRDFANVLKTLTGGQTVQATVLRGGEKKTFAVTVVER